MQSILVLAITTLSLQLAAATGFGGPKEIICNIPGFVPTTQHGHPSASDMEGYDVQLYLTRNGKPVDCVQPKKTYKVVINATKEFRGFIITAVKPGESRPSNDAAVGRFRIPAEDYYHYGTCANTISHSKVLVTNRVELVWRSPSKPSEPVQFLYTIVFERYLWLANLTTVFSDCIKCLSNSPDDDDPSFSGESAYAGSAEDMKNCVPTDSPVEEAFNTTRDIPIKPGLTITANYTCSDPDVKSLKVCKGKCTYCDHKCQYTSRIRQPIKYTCRPLNTVTNENGDKIVLLPFPRRKTHRSDTACSCM